MQQIAHSPAYVDQHVPNGWTFPTLAQGPAQPAPTPHPVAGGGAAQATVTKVRWGRLLPLVAGIAILAFGIWTATASPSSKDSSGDGSRSVSGGGSSSELDIAAADRG